MRYLMSVVLVAAAVALAGAETVQSPDGYSVEPPDGWFAIQKASWMQDVQAARRTGVDLKAVGYLGASACFVNPKAGQAVPAAHVRIEVRSFGGEFVADETEATRVKKEMDFHLKVDRAKVEQLEAKVVRIAGRDAVQTDYAGPVFGVDGPVKQRQYRVSAGKTLVLVTFTAAADAYGQHEAAFAKVADSLKIDAAAYVPPPPAPRPEPTPPVVTPRPEPTPTPTPPVVSPRPTPRPTTPAPPRTDIWSDLGPPPPAPETPPSRTPIEIAREAAREKERKQREQMSQLPPVQPRKPWLFEFLQDTSRLMILAGGLLVVIGGVMAVLKLRKSKRRRPLAAGLRPFAPPPPAAPSDAAPAEPAATLPSALPAAPAAGIEQIELACTCGKKLRVPASASGRKGRCPHCGAILNVP